MTRYLFVPQFFTLLEAEGLLPQVEGLLRTLIQLKQDHETADGQLNGINQRIALSGGMIPPREQVQQIRARREACARGLKAALEKIQEIGCELKDIEIGLVDFPTLYRGKEVYLCGNLASQVLGSGTILRMDIAVASLLTANSSRTTALARHGQWPRSDP